MQITDFIFAILPIALSPGASFTLAISSVPISGMKGAGKVILGTALGIFINALLVGLGVSSFIIKSEIAMMGLNIFGILFLLWLGIKLLKTGIASIRSPKQIKASAASTKEALILNLFNVKAILLYLTVVPIFAGDSLQNYLVLASIHVGIMTVWVLACSVLLLLAKKKLNLNLISSVVNTIGGLFLIQSAINYAITYCVDFMV